MNTASGLPIQFVDVTKKFGSFTALASFSLSIVAGEFLTILGESGSGKSTILNSLAGFTRIDDGSIQIGGRPVHELPPEQRNIGMVFQNYSLFPHMTVAQNVGFPLRMRGVGKAEVAVRVDQALGTVRLSGYGSRLPRELSGGQQQRVALARAISFSPPILLMDEPLGALDLKLRETLQFEVKEIQRQLGCTVVYVTHDQREAMAMSDRIVVLRAGRIEQLGSSEEIYDKPVSKFVADFIGQTNFIDVELQPDRTIRLPQLGVSFRHDGPLPDGDRLFLNLRPEMLTLRDTAGPSVAFEAVVHATVFQGDAVSVSARTDRGHQLYFRQPRTAYDNSVKEGQRITLSFDPAEVSIVPEKA